MHWFLFFANGRRLGAVHCTLRDVVAAFPGASVAWTENGTQALVTIMHKPK